MNRYTIKIPQIKLFGYHGCYEDERLNGQEFEISISVSYTTRWEAIDVQYDDLASHIDYSILYKLVLTIFNERRYNLLEALANDIALGIANHYSIGLVNVKVKKLNPAGMDIPYIEVQSQYES